MGEQMDVLSILNRDPINSREFISSEFFTDLNLNQIIDRISRVWGKNVKPFYQYFPQSPEAVQYRRDVYADIEKMYEPMLTVYEAFEKCRMIADERARSIQPARQVMLFSNEIALYCDAVRLLEHVLATQICTSEGLRKLSAAISEYTQNDHFTELQKQADYVRRELTGTRMTLTYENKRIVLALEEREGTYEKTLKGLSREDISMDSPFADSFDLEGIELELMELYMHKKPELFKAAATLYKKEQNYSRDWVVLFGEELAFYLSFIKFAKEMQSEGAQFAMPLGDENVNMRAEGLYDLALFLMSRDRQTAVVDNDFYYDENERFFVLTGPNQGGKTTFARSLGQLVYFGKIGLPVPARSANVHYFMHLLTHFSVEESVETGRGKLMEELVRLAPLMQAASGNSFVIINELFTTAANYDACIMGKKVLKHFVEQDCHGIYVTHLTELLEAQERAVGLSARLDENGVQTFKIERAVMEYTNCAGNQVEKYGLTYAKLKERLG